MTVLQRAGISLHFEEHGSGLPVVLGHSFLCSGEMWAPQVPPLSRAHRVVNVDTRGHGRSAPAHEPFTIYDLVEDVLAVLDHLGIERAVWAGLSIGGMVGLRAALEAPERVAALMLLDTHAGAETRLTKIEYRTMDLTARLLGLRALAPGIRRIMFGRTTRRENPALVRSWSARMVGNDLRSIRFGIHALMRRDALVGRLAEIRVPALVLVGEEDRALPPACSREIDALLPDSRLVVVPRAGHLSTLEQPEAVTEAMLGFLRELG